jgi:hypothetical protein
MNWHPILYSTPMVQAILQGRKTMTRRIMKIQPNEDGVSYMKNAPLDWEQIYNDVWKPWKLETDEGEALSVLCPYGCPGDILWVRERFELFDRGTDDNGFDGYLRYVADQKEIRWPSHPLSPCIKPSIHMPKAACRLFLKIKSIKVERLHDISQADAIAEGVERLYNTTSLVYKNYMFKDDVVDAKNSFKSLWQKINGIESWQQNPWVWVIKFEKID